MPFVIYNLANSISTFFFEAGSSTSREECDAFVRERYGHDISIQPAPIQGVSSYTVFVGNDKVVQFREHTSLLDIPLLNLVREIHGEDTIVPRCVEIGWIGGLGVYEMTKLSGEALVMVRSSLDGCQRERAVWKRFFAQSWLKSEAATLTSGFDISTLRSTAKEECDRRLEYLSQTLPARLQPFVTEIQTTFSYPIVLTHADLNETNTLLSPSTGSLSGILDWAGASFLPFGFSLYALENFLGGWMGQKGWTWLPHSEQLRNIFWETFCTQTGLEDVRLIKLAAKAGILIRYGIAWDARFEGMIGVRDPNLGGGDEYRSLDALLFSNRGETTE
ncbi:hypothetical protein QBC35DRAFT_542047 [Podospora australis]|uniref:Aminoglycoside phosphotransferase domain-containing protein n=1 Tax=Podospora australis TaxID=1536484 RepID=A0AAN7ALH1_9PEZI|nr:hypothetical protein QBC35DRAFT_542047 [Podospora australis]